jgi:hypothetical protein
MRASSRERLAALRPVGRAPVAGGLVSYFGCLRLHRGCYPNSNRVDRSLVIALVSVTSCNRVGAAGRFVAATSPPLAVIVAAIWSTP